MCLVCFPLDMVNRKESSFCFHQGVGVACPKQNRPEQTCWLWWFGHGCRFSIVCNARSSSTLTRLRLQLLGQASGMDPAEEKRKGKRAGVFLWRLGHRPSRQTNLRRSLEQVCRSCEVVCLGSRAAARGRCTGRSSREVPLRGQHAPPGACGQLGGPKHVCHLAINWAGGNNRLGKFYSLQSLTLDFCGPRRRRFAVLATRKCWRWLEAAQ